MMEPLFRLFSIHVHDSVRSFRPYRGNIDCILVSAAWKSPPPRLPERAAGAGCALPLVRAVGFEPTRISPPEPKSGVSAVPPHPHVYRIVYHMPWRNRRGKWIRARKTRILPAGRIGKRIGGDTEPSGGKRGEEEGEKPIGRIEKRGEERELSLPAHRKGNAGRKAMTSSRSVKPDRGTEQRIA